ncbi:DeoR/GlpR family DNA-binding transcription regulator [Brevibacillus sp. SYSU BS000544]|uniref:DeoR/GlpR family DNA-binding transcription regulator n=1 Tax=Brevibacillus sp. SYSU BS000544 TaxID=3416443 RepID=UPI003CE54089
MSLIGEERKTYILELLYSAGKVRTNDLVEKLQVSSETIRRYLEELEYENKCKRVYGGAVKINLDREEPSLYTREILRAEEKKHIGRMAATQVQNGDIILIDDGTTSLQMIHFLGSKKNLTILTNSVTGLTLLVDSINKGLLDTEVFFIGGKVQSKHYRVVGSVAMQMMESFNVDKAFISIDGMLLNKGITSFDEERALLARKFIEHASQSIVLTDHSKLGTSHLYKIADLKEIDIIISDVSAPKDWVDELKTKDIEWLVAE